MNTDKIRITIIALFFVVTICSGQEKEPVFGKVNPDEIAMQDYAQDTDAKAVVLYDKGKSTFEDSGSGYRIWFTRYKRIKVFDKSEHGVAEVYIPLYTSSNGNREEKIKSLQAITYFQEPDGIKTRVLDPEHIYTEKISDRLSVQKFTFPEVQDGAVLEYKYEMESPFLFSLPEWRFQDKIPTIYSEYEVHMVPFYAYAYLVQGVSKFDEHYKKLGSESKYFSFGSGGSRRYQDNIHTYILRDVPAFEDESFITSVNDHIIKMNFQLVTVYGARGEKRDIISSWPELNEELLDHDDFGKFIRRASRKTKSIVEDKLNLDGKSSQDKAKAIIQYVKNNFVWNQRQGKYASQTVNELLESKIGTAADLNLLLLGMLDRAGVEASPVILSTREHGKIATAYPMDRFTNYVIAFVSADNPYLTDATARGLPYNRLPPRCINEKGLVVEKNDTPKWFRLSNNVSSIDQKKLQLKLDTLTNDVKATVIMQSTDLEAYRYRKEFGKDKDKIRKYFNGILSEIQRIEVQNFAENAKPYLLYLEGIQETENLNNNIVIRPFIGLPQEENILKQQHRLHPVDFVYLKTEKYETNLSLPKGYKVIDVPDNYEAENELVNIQVEYKTAVNQLSALAKFELKQAIYDARNYQDLKQSFDDMIKHFNEVIVIQKQG